MAKDHHRGGLASTGMTWLIVATLGTVAAGAVAWLLVLAARERGGRTS